MSATKYVLCCRATQNNINMRNVLRLPRPQPHPAIPRRPVRANLSEVLRLEQHRLRKALRKVCKLSE